MQRHRYQHARTAIIFTRVHPHISEYLTQLTYSQGGKVAPNAQDWTALRVYSSYSGVVSGPSTFGEVA